MVSHELFNTIVYLVCICVSCSENRHRHAFPGSCVMKLCRFFHHVLKVQVAHLTLTLAFVILSVAVCDAHREAIFCALTTKCEILHPVVCMWG